MLEKEQVQPLSPAASIRRSHEDDGTALRIEKIRQKKYVKCCVGCVSAGILIIVILIVILALIVFKVKDPVLTLNGFTLVKFEAINGTMIPQPGTNITIIADVSVKNPNRASFRYPNATTKIFYRGDFLAYARSAPGRARALRTARMNLTVDVIVDRLTPSIPNLLSDMRSGMVTMSSFTRVGGRVSIFKIIKKHVVAKLKCTISVNVTSQAIVKQDCDEKFKL